MTKDKKKRRAIPQQTKWKRIWPSRALSTWERAMIDRLLMGEWPHRDKFERQLASARVTHEYDGDPSVLLNVDESPENRVPDMANFMIGTFVSRMDGRDSDGMFMFAMLKANDGFAYVLEVQRADGSSFTELPPPEAFTDSDS